MNITQFKKYFFSFIIIVILAFITKVTYKYIATQYQFNQIIKEAANIPEDIWDKKYENMQIKDKYKIVLVVCDGGELSYAEYFKIAAEKQGWNVVIYNKSIEGKERDIIAYDPDIIIFSNFVSPDVNMQIRAHRSKKILLNFLPIKSYKDFNRKIRLKLLPPSPYILYDKMDEVIEISDAVITIAKEIDFYRQNFEYRNKPFFDGFRIFPVVHKIENTPAEPKTLMWGGVGSDKIRYSQKYKDFIKKLSENIPVKVYGPYRNFRYLAPGIYDGYTMFGMEYIENIRENGIYLLTHGQFHFDGNIPGLRIFEAVAANAVVISDKLPFAIEHFGDSFLYFDREADEETMYNQVKAHYDWIKANPEKAKEMAARAHQIYLEKFTIEKDLIRIAKMYEYIIKREKDAGLKYPFVF